MQQKRKEVYFFDTSALLNGYKLQTDNINIISLTVLEELENIKTSNSKSEDIKYKARSLIRYLMRHDNWTTTDATIHMFINNDDYLLQQANKLAKQYKTQINFVTSDAAQFLRAKKYKNLIPTFFSETSTRENLWSGYKEKILYTEDELNILYSNPDSNILNLETNEYCIIKNPDGNILDLIKWTGIENEVIKYKDMKSDFFGKVHPLNTQQKFFFDLLQNRNITVKLIRGQFGSGKTFISLVHAINYIDWHNFDKIIYIRNNIEVLGSQKLGALPGEERDKLLPFLMPIADHLGSVDYMNQCIDEGKIEPIHLGFIRGRNFKRSILFVDEAENLTTDNVKLIIGRADKGSEVWFLGDESQTDSDIFKKNSGIAALLSSLKGNPKFGTIELQQSERSETAQLAAIIKGGD